MDETAQRKTSSGLRSFLPKIDNHIGLTHNPSAAPCWASIMIRSRSFVYFSLGFGVAFATLAVLSTIWSRSSHDTRNPYKRKKVIAFGDSITQHGFNTDIHGWVSKMADWWTRRVDMINRGYSGYNTRWARLIFEDVVIPEKPDFLFIFFGANDAIEVLEVHHVPLAEYTDNLRAIVGLARKKFPTLPIVMITPPPVCEESLVRANAPKGRGLDRTNERTLTYVNACKKVAKEFNVPVVDAWVALEGDSANRSKYLSDGLHPNDLGNLAIFQAIKKVMGEYFHDWLPELMPMQMPTWNEIDYSNPALSFPRR